MGRLTPTNGNHNFQFIPILQLLRGTQTARHDFAVAFQCYALAGQAHVFYECGHTGGIGKLASCAVNADGDHFLFGTQLDKLDEVAERDRIVAGRLGSRRFTINYTRGRCDSITVFTIWIKTEMCCCGSTRLQLPGIQDHHADDFARDGHQTIADRPGPGCSRPISGLPRACLVNMQFFDSRMADNWFLWSLLHPDAYAAGKVQRGMRIRVTGVSPKKSALQQA